MKQKEQPYREWVKHKSIQKGIMKQITVGVEGGLERRMKPIQEYGH